jgi:hypothetical protein
VRAVHGRAGIAIGRLRVELNRSLFVPAPSDRLRFSGREGAVVVVAFVALAAALQLLRAGPTDSLNALFAEDGPVYLGGALTHGVFDSLTSSYAEYLVVIPRLIGEAGTILPLRYAPETMNLIAVLLVALSGVAVWVGSGGLIRNPFLRLLLVALALLPPTSGMETVATATNVPWYTSFAVFWLLIWRPANTRSACLGATLILATGLSSPIIFFFVPLAALRAIAVRDRRDALIVGAFGLALAIQLPVTASSSEQVSQSAWTDNLVTVFLQRVVDGVALGLELDGEAWVQWGWPFLIAIGVLVVATLSLLALRATSGRLFALIAVVTAVVVFFASGYHRSLGDEMVWPTGSFNPLGSRYTMIPVLLLASATLVLLDGRLRSSKGVPWAAIAISGMLVIAIVTSFGGDAGRQMPSWPQSLREGSAKCRRTGAGEAVVPIAPAGWMMTIHCDRLESEYATGPAG